MHGWVFKQRGSAYERVAKGGEKETDSETKNSRIGGDGRQRAMAIKAKYDCTAFDHILQGLDGFLASASVQQDCLE